MLELEQKARGKKETELSDTVARLREELRERDARDAQLVQGKKEMGLAGTVSKLRKALRDKEDELKRSKESAEALKKKCGELADANENLKQRLEEKGHQAEQL